MLSQLLAVLPAFALLSAPAVHGLDNGLGMIPQRGWNTWNKYGCNINETIVLKNAQALVDSGLKDAGYEYAVIDDCWQAAQRDSEGRLQPDAEKFPSGFKNLTDTIHNMGLKAGIYSSAGTLTCGRHLASLYHEDIDAQTFADWGFDYLKYDNCFNEGLSGNAKISFDRYNNMTQALNKTGRPMFYSGCQWGQDNSFNWAPQVFNSWRISGDIYDSFDRYDARCPCSDMTTETCNLQGFHCSVRKIVGFAKSLGQKAFPGAWLDLDMLEVGNGGMTRDEYVTHFSMWAMMRSAMILGNELFSMDNQTLAIVGNKHVLDLISGDSMGSPAYPVSGSQDQDVELWFSQLVNGTFAAALVNWGSQNLTGQSFNFTDFFVDDREARKGSYDVYDLWDGVDFEAGTIPEQPTKMNGSPFSNAITGLDVPAHGVRLLRLVPAGTNGMGTSAEEKARRDLEDAEHIRTERALQWQRERDHERRIAGRGL